MTNVHLFKVEKSVLKQQNEKSNHYQSQTGRSAAQARRQEIPYTIHKVCQQLFNYRNYSD